MAELGEAQGCARCGNVNGCQSHAPAPARSDTPDQLAEEPQTPRVQICRVVITERFSKAFSGVHYRKMFAAAERNAARPVLGPGRKMEGP